MIYINKNSLYKWDCLKKGDYHIVDIFDFRLVFLKIEKSENLLMKIYINNIEPYLKHSKNEYEKEIYQKIIETQRIYQPLIFDYIEVSKNKYFEILNYQSKLISKYGKEKVLNNQNGTVEYMKLKVNHYERFTDKNFCEILRNITFGIYSYTDNTFLNWLISNNKHLCYTKFVENEKSGILLIRKFCKNKKYIKNIK